MIPCYFVLFSGNFPAAFLYRYVSSSWQRLMILPMCQYVNSLYLKYVSFVL